MFFHMTCVILVCFSEFSYSSSFSFGRVVVNPSVPRLFYSLLQSLSVALSGNSSRTLCTMIGRTADIVSPFAVIISVLYGIYLPARLAFHGFRHIWFWVIGLLVFRATCQAKKQGSCDDAFDDCCHSTFFSLDTLFQSISHEKRLDFPLIFPGTDYRST